MEEPGKRDLSHVSVVVGGDLTQLLEDGPVLLYKAGFRDLARPGSLGLGTVLLVLARQKVASQGAVGYDADSERHEAANQEWKEKLMYHPPGLFNPYKVCVTA